MDLHGIKLRKPKKSSPLQQPSAPSTSTPNLHEPNSPEPASAQPALHGIQRQQSSPQAHQEGGHEEDSQQPQQQQPLPQQQQLQQQVMAAPAVEVSTEGPNASQHMQAVEASIHATVMEDAVDADVEVMDEPNAETQNTPMQQDHASDDDMVWSCAPHGLNGAGTCIDLPGSHPLQSGSHTQCIQMQNVYIVCGPTEIMCCTGTESWHGFTPASGKVSSYGVGAV